jgi:hypothetical protein
MHSVGFFAYLVRYLRAPELEGHWSRNCASLDVWASPASYKDSFTLYSHEIYKHMVHIMKITTSWAIHQCVRMRVILKYISNLFI